MVVSVGKEGYSIEQTGGVIFDFKRKLKRDVIVA